MFNKLVTATLRDLGNERQIFSRLVTATLKRLRNGKQFVCTQIREKPFKSLLSSVAAGNTLLLSWRRSLAFLMGPNKKMSLEGDCKMKIRVTVMVQLLKTYLLCMEYFYISFRARGYEFHDSMWIPLSSLLADSGFNLKPADKWLFGMGPYDVAVCLRKVSLNHIKKSSRS